MKKKQRKPWKRGVKEKKNEEENEWEYLPLEVHFILVIGALCACGMFSTFLHWFVIDQQSAMRREKGMNW